MAFLHLFIAIHKLYMYIYIFFDRMKCNVLQCVQTGSHMLPPKKRLPNTGEVRGSPQTSFEQRRDGRFAGMGNSRSRNGFSMCSGQIIFWLVVEPTHLKHISQIGKSSPTRDEHEKYLSCHHLVFHQPRFLIRPVPGHSRPIYSTHKSHPPTG